MGRRENSDTENEARLWAESNGFTIDNASAQSIDQAAHEAATSPQNDTLEPSQAQKEAGNYKVGRVKIAGLDISIENPEGSTRSGTDPNGKPWSITMQSHYGYIRSIRRRGNNLVNLSRVGDVQLTRDAANTVPSGTKLGDLREIVGTACISNQGSQALYF